MRLTRIVSMLALVSLIAGAAGAQEGSGGAGSAAPWAVPDDPAVALREPDRFAWQLFRALTWPADLDTRMADPEAAYGAEVPVVFQTWILASAAYPDNGGMPAPWEEFNPETVVELDGTDGPLQLSLLREIPPIPPGTEGHQADEVRMNRPAFDYIRENGLYSTQGQQRFYYGQREVSFPPEAIEIKAVWRPITPEQADRYHWSRFRDAESGETLLYGLTALHIMSKILPRWHWSTFEHVDNPFRDGIHDEGWLNRSRDSLACPPERLDCNLAPEGLGLEGTHWENYRLRGSQIEFTDDMGNPVILANSELETGFQTTASCMSCHVRATIGPNVNAPASFEFGPGHQDHPLAPPRASRMSVFNVAPDGRITSYFGTPDPDQFRIKGMEGPYAATYTLLDYAWSLARAKPQP
ncbi:hypothetical protein NIM87_06695 [Devosia sp. XJ19-1]|uniref:Cytochrome c domain-containing protein n=1 Tax=Devosia ureilytica TaxID=2952754 RepID=A0A9Q4AMR1_9HYPH|nr:hypothetical protein [Devosia ureilytica]MCP8883181.1 hypothetical protein [Devosia ureilytica]MCP8886451.1 hypothetical protein [Devosia ureilytica]